MSSTPPPVYSGYYPRRSIAGPLILILLGVVFLCANAGLLHWRNVGMWFARFWPLLLILWGAVKLIEWMHDRSEGRPARGIGGGGVVFVIFLIIFGFAATRAARVNWQAVGNEIDADNDFFGVFGQTYTFTNEQEQALAPTVTSAQIASDRGDITVTTWDEPKVKIVAHKRIMAGSQYDANEVDKSTTPSIRIEGSTLLINANTGGGHSVEVRVFGTQTSGHAITDMEVFLPKNVAADASTRRGDISIRTRTADVKADTQRGDVNVGEITGAASVTLRRGSVRVEKISGDVNIEGRVNDSDISDIGGALRLNGEFTGQLRLARIAKGVSFNSSRTDLKFGKLDGEMTMDLGDLRAAQIAGPFSITTRSKDIRLDEITGDVRVDNTNGEIEIHATKLPLGNIDISNRKGEVHLTLPAGANFEVDARTRRGDIEQDFGLNVNAGRGETAATGTVGKGGPRVHIDSEYGGIRLRKG
jgi:DUF4097 and DUF4098 domain-containing protein YvlB